LVAIAVLVVTLGPGLGELRSRFAHARPGWIVIACAFEVQAGRHHRDRRPRPRNINRSGGEIDRERQART
jgi:hypothetical protein